MHLFLMPAYLRDKASHPYSETLGWRRWCDANGVGLQIFGHRLAEPEVMAATGAVPAFGLDAETMARLGLPTEHPLDPLSGRLDRFMRQSASAARAARLAWSQAEARPDAVILPWGLAGWMNGMADWLADLDPDERPALGVNIVRPEDDWAADAGRRKVTGDFSFMRYAGKRLKALLGESRLAITAVDPRLCRTLSQACGVPAHPISPHVTYPTEAEFEAWRSPAPADGVTVGLMGVNRWEKAGGQAAALIGAISAARPQAQFFMQVADTGEAESLAQALAGQSVRLGIQLGALEHDAYWRRLLANDLMLMPYQGPYYAMTPSGPFCEALASGIPVVVPRQTWMGDRLADGFGAGEIFDTAEATDIVAATVRAIDRLAALKTEAAALAPAWRRDRSLDAHIVTLLALLGLA